MARTRKPSAPTPLFGEPASAPAAPAGPERRWTAAQQAVIDHVAGDLLVSAAAGSGKTAVLAERCARLVTMDGPQRTTVERLLVLTFTDAAAAEMRSRIAGAIRQKIAALRDVPGQAADRRALLGQSAQIERASISTLHAFCARTLRNYFHEVGLDPAFEILDEEEARLLRDEILNDLLVRYHQLSATDPRATPFAEFYEAYAQGRDSAVKEFIGAIHAMLASLKDPAGWLAEARLAYTPAGATRLLAQYAARIARQLDMLGARCTRDMAELRRAGVAPLAAYLEGFAALLAQAAPRLAADPTAWDAVANEINAFEFPTIRRPKEFPADEWDVHKEATFGKLKPRLKELQQFTFALPRQRLIDDLVRLAGPLEILLQMTHDFQEAYRTVKMQQNRLDFSDLERCTFDLLAAPGAAARADLRQRYDHILVDEFQDINPLQAAILETLRDPHQHGGRGNLFVVGDIKQSIYGFRLADPQLFAQMEIQRRACTTHTALIALQNNFRSLPPLLANLNALFGRLLTPGVAGIDYPQGHELFPPPTAAAIPPAPAPLPPVTPFTGTPIEFHIALTEGSADAEDEDGAAADPEPGTADAETAALSATEHEARMVAARIADLMAAGHGVVRQGGATGPLRYADIAILLRGMKNRAHIFARALAAANIPVHADLSTGYFDAPEVSDTLALLSTLDNPLQDIPLVATMLSPYGRFTHDDLARIRLAHGRGPVPFHAAVPQYMLAPPGEAAATALAARLEAFFALLARYRTLTRHHPLHEALAQIYRDSAITAYVAGLPGGAQRLANLQMLHQRALQFSGFRKQGLYRFLKFIERLRAAEGDLGEAPVFSEASDVVRILSIHKSKGLEFPVVFLAALGTNFNVRSGGPVRVQRDLHVALQVADVERNIFYDSVASKSASQELQRVTRAEELRLLYVAMTRARNHLILTGATKPATLANLRRRWQQHTGPLPDDILLGGRNYLDWLVPLAASADLGARWPDSAPAAAPLQVFVHSPDSLVSLPSPAPPTTPIAAAVAPPLVTSILARQPLPAPADDPVIQALGARLEGRYAYTALTELPALFTVSGLKAREQLATEPEAPAAAPLPEALPVETLTQPAWLVETIPGAPPSAIPSALPTDPYAARGIATHRVLQLLNFAALQRPEDVGRQIDLMVARHELPAADAALVNRDDLAWFLFAQRLGQELRTIAETQYGAVPEVPAPADWEAQTRAAGHQAQLLDPARPQLLRELPFTYALDPGTLLRATPAARAVPVAAADRPQVRGIIDLLLVTPTGGRIIDYKTDHPGAVADRLAMYQRQMRYYMEAATAILQRPVARATLVFLAARRMEEVAL